MIIAGQVHGTPLLFRTNHSRTSGIDHVKSPHYICTCQGYSCSCIGESAAHPVLTDHGNGNESDDDESEDSDNKESKGNGTKGEELLFKNNFYKIQSKPFK